MRMYDVEVTRDGDQIVIKQEDLMDSDGGDMIVITVEQAAHVASWIASLANKKD